jgi:hypothetical protein
MSDRTFDPFAIERPKLRLGEHGEWFLGDIHEARQAKLEELQPRLADIESSEDAKLKDVAERVGELAEAVCDDSVGLAAKIVDLTDSAKHGDRAIGINGLRGLATFIKEHLEEIAHAGES